MVFVWDSSKIYFVVRHKDNIKFKTLKELQLPKERHQHLLKDEIIELTGTKTKEKYPKKLRRVALWDQKNQQTIEVITNQMSWTANTITELYKARWEVEIFFRDIKQQLHIKSFIGTSHKCSYDTDMDRTDNNTDFEGTKSTSKTRLVFIKSSSFYKAKSVCKSRLTQMAR